MDRDQQIVNLTTDSNNNFTPSWENRRKVIFITLMLCAIVLTLMSFIIMIRMTMPLFTGSEIDFGQAMSNIVGMVFSSVLMFAATIIGLYVFGVNLDTSNFRRTTANLFSTITPNSSGSDDNSDPSLNRGPPRDQGRGGR